MAIFELREYKVRAGKMKEWVKLFENEIIPFQVAKGMVICASFVSHEEGAAFMWLRRFDSEDERTRLQKAVYETEFWVNNIAPKLGELLHEDLWVTKLVPTPASPIR